MHSIVRVDGIRKLLNALSIKCQMLWTNTKIFEKITFYDKINQRFLKSDEMTALVEFDKISKSIVCSGDWDKIHVLELSKKIKSFDIKEKKINIDTAKITSLDTSGAMLILQIQKQFLKHKISSKIINSPINVKKLLSLCEENYTDLPKEPKKPFMVSKVFYKIGENAVESLKTFISFFSFLGGVTKAILKIFINPFSWRFKATLYHIEKNGLNAIPIIALTSLLIGVVIAFQGAVQLEKFGANIFIVEMVGISATRELAPLIVAIVIAGRSASAFSAQLGVMKITEEVDAMKTLGFNSWDFLIAPRVIALVIVMPLLVIFADAVSILGGMIVAKTELNITFYEFANRLKENLGLKNLLIGLGKAPIFGWIIATIGCFRGFQISSNTESVGKYTTISVVNAIFWVIAFDALASVFLTKIDI